MSRDICRDDMCEKECYLCCDAKFGPEPNVHLIINFCIYGIYKFIYYQSIISFVGIHLNLKLVLLVIFQLFLYDRAIFVRS